MYLDRSIEQDLRVLEESVLEPGLRASAEEIEGLLAEEFVEFGASGSVYDRRRMIDSLRAETPIRRSLSDFQVRLLGPGVALATYRATSHGEHGKPRAHSPRSSVWKHVGGRWQLVFHQGTTTTEEPS